LTVFAPKKCDYDAESSGKEQTMSVAGNALTRVIVVAIILVFTSAGYVFARGLTTTEQDQQVQSIPAGEKVTKLKGIVGKRDPDSFKMTDTMGGKQTVVILTADTEVKSHKRGVFRGSKEYGASYILRGLRLEVDGVGNSEGQLVAEKIRFDEQDLRSAQALKSTVDPIEAEVNEKLRLQQQEQERLAGQLEENRALTEKAQASADAAAEAARKAQSTADYANNRINGLDDFDTLKTIVVNFNTNSASLGPKAKATIDEAAAWVKTQNTKGWVMAVIGYADTTGNSQRNIDLSERRANAVIYYVVSKYKMPLNRLVQPFGYGQLEPVADNKTKTGRAKNRRVEIRLMINKGIAGTVAGGN
jgi:outer membrane protein OmpA-like peptidoglycan-associated protein